MSNNTDSGEISADRGVDPVGATSDDGQRLHVQYSEQYVGQFPHPAHLADYQEMYPEAPRIIFEAFEKQGEHRREMERLLLTGSERRASVGQYLGSAVLLVVVVLGFVAIVCGQPVAGATMVTAALAGGILAFAFGGAPGHKGS